MKVRSLIIFALLACLGFSAFASQEGMAPLGKFSLTSSANSAPVTVTGEANQGNISSLQVVAFGKAFSLTSEQLAKLKGTSFNGIQLSSESGYAGMGGHTLYIVLLRGFSSGTISRVVITVEEERGITIQEGHSK